MNLFKHIPLLAAILLLAACTSENTLETTTPPDEEGTSDGNTREVLLLLKNKLQVTPVETKAAGDPIATTAENHIYSLDVYVLVPKRKTAITHSSNSSITGKTLGRRFPAIMPPASP